MEIHFRPHHFLCTLCFQGKGYSPAFIANFQAIFDTLHQEEGDNALITITSKTDDICKPCPNRSQEHCKTQEKITVLDNAHATALEIKPEQTITWGDAKEKIKEKITLEKFHEICANCSWKNYGICEKTLKEFLNL